MAILSQLIRYLISAISILFQQGLVFGVGLLVYDAGVLFWAVFVWALAIPMLWLNYWTFKYVMKYGFINFFKMNADTSDIDVPKGK